MAEKRLTSAQKRNLTLRGLFELEGSQKENVRAETGRFIKELEGVVDPVSGQNVLDMKVQDMDVGQVVGDVIEKSKFGISDAENNPETRTRSQGLIVRLKTMFGGAGYSTDYVNKEVQNYLGEDAYEANTKMSLFRARKTLLGLPDDIYPKLKTVLQDPNLPQDTKLQFSAHLFGGFRPATLKEFDIKNFDAQKGIISVYDAKSKKTKVTVLNPVLVDIFKQASEGRKTGPIFLDVTSNTKIINDRLKNVVGEVSFLKPSGNIEKEQFSVYKLRNMNETLLSETGLNTEDTAFLSGRAQATEAGGYVTQKSRKRRVDRAGQEVVAKIIGYSGDANPAQFGADTGLKLSAKSKNIPILTSLLDDEDYVKALPEGFLESLPEEGQAPTGKAAEADPELTEQRRLQALEESRKVTEAAGLEADDLERERRRLALEQPELTEEEALRLARERATRQQATQQVKQEKKAETAAAEKQAAREDLKGFFERAREALSKLPPPVKKAIPIVGTTASLFAADAKRQEAKAAAEEGRPIVAALRGAQAVEEVASPLPITTGDVEDVVRLMGKAKPTPEQRSGPLGLAPGELSRQVEEITRPERGTRVTSAQMDELMSK